MHPRLDALPSRRLGSFRFGRLVVGCLALLGPLARAEAAEPSPSPEAPPLDYGLVVTGGELLEGVYPDAHTVFITRTLRPLGGHCVASITVDDQRDAMHAALRLATNRAKLVLITGGLGPTPNDITRETLAEFTGIPLHEHPEVIASMERRFGQTRDQLRPNLRKQALVPTRGGYLPNPSGTAVGLVYTNASATFIALPGPPRELQPMVQNELTRYLQREFGAHALGASLTLRFVGVGQSQIDQTLHEKVPLPPEVLITSLFEGSRVDFTFHLPHDNAEARSQLQKLHAAVREVLGEHLYGEGTTSLEGVVLARLAARGESLACAEVGSGGQLAAAFNLTPLPSSTSSAGQPHPLTGALAAPTETALRRLLHQAPADPADDDATRARALAAALAREAGTTWTIATSEAKADASGSRTVWVVLLGPDNRIETRRLNLRDRGELARASLVTQILDEFRRLLK